MATAEAPTAKDEVEQVAADADGSNGDGCRSSSRQPEVTVVDAGDEPITMPSLCMNCYENVREEKRDAGRENERNESSAG